MADRRHNSRTPSTTAARAMVLLLLLLHSTASAMSLTRLLGGGAGRERKSGTVWGRELTGRQGPGSSPPSCRSKCGMCSPCKPVHVSVQPGTVMPLEYYPEAWRCRCGNKFYLP